MRKVIQVYLGYLDRWASQESLAFLVLLGVMAYLVNQGVVDLLENRSVASSEGICTCRLFLWYM